MMGLYRKRPVIVHAWQWDGAPACTRALVDMGVPVNLRQTTASNLAFWCEASNATVEIHLLDWIIAEKDGTTFYPCRNIDFIRAYERAL